MKIRRKGGRERKEGETGHGTKRKTERKSERGKERCKEPELVTKTEMCSGSTESTSQVDTMLVTETPAT